MNNKQSTPDKWQSPALILLEKPGKLSFKKKKKKIPPALTSDKCTVSKFVLPSKPFAQPSHRGAVPPDHLCTPIHPEPRPPSAQAGHISTI